MKEHPDTIADRALAATLHGVVTDPIAMYEAARATYERATGCNREQARAAIRRALVRAALKSESQDVREKGMAVHTRR